MLGLTGIVSQVRYLVNGGEQGCRSPPAKLARFGSAPARSPLMVPSPRFDRDSPALQAGAFTRLAYWA